VAEFSVPISQNDDSGKFCVDDYDYPINAGVDDILRTAHAPIFVGSSGVITLAFVDSIAAWFPTMFSMSAEILNYALHAGVGKTAGTWVIVEYLGQTTAQPKLPYDSAIGFAYRSLVWIHTFLLSLRLARCLPRPTSSIRPSDGRGQSFVPGRR
jgi:hypothetical protein